MAEEISVGPWTISARRDDTGTLSIEVRLRGERHATLELHEEEPADRARRAKLEADMDF